MATYTSHYNLKKPATSDKIRIADFNGNADTIDATMYDNATLGAQLKADIGIVENTNTATHNISAGQYVIWKGSLYTASSAISSGATLSDANLTAVSGGGLNALNGKTTPEAVTTTTVSGFTKRIPCRAKKIGNLVTLFLDVIASSAITISSTYTKVLTLPADYNPSGDVFGIVYVNGKDILACNVYNGDVQVRSINNSVSLSSSDIIRGGISWVVNE